MKIIPLSEGSFTVDQSKEFVPFQLSEDELNQRPRGSLLVEIQPFIVVTSKDILLLDTGLGFIENNQLQLIQNIKNKGMMPQQITKVLLSHLHKDHAGGISVRDRLGHYHLSLPQAEYYVHKNELEYAFNSDGSSYHKDALGILNHHHKVHLLENDKGSIDDYIKYEITGGHSKYHVAYWITDGNETAFFGGDEAPVLKQMKSRFVAKYDYDGKRAMELRQKWKQEGAEGNWTFLFYHDIKNAVSKIEK